MYENVLWSFSFSHVQMEKLQSCLQWKGQKFFLLNNQITWNVGEGSFVNLKSNFYDKIMD